MQFRFLKKRKYPAQQIYLFSHLDDQPRWGHGTWATPESRRRAGVRRNYPGGLVGRYSPHVVSRKNPAPVGAEAHGFKDDTFTHCAFAVKVEDDCGEVSEGQEKYREISRKRIAKMSLMSILEGAAQAGQHQNE